MIGLKDVADHAGVSASTVSRVLAGKTYVSEATRERVWEAIDTLGYRPNTLAQSLKSGTSNTLALIIPSIQNQMFPHLVRGAEDYARQAGYTLVLCNTDEDLAEEKRYIDTLRGHLVAGFIIATMLPSSDHIRQLREEGMPLVLTSRSYDSSIDVILIDNRLAAYKATNHLIRGGAKRIAIALGNMDLSIYQERLSGFRDALRENDLEADENLLIGNDDDADLLYQRFWSLLDDKSVDGIFATTDQKAFVAMRAIHDRGLRIPDDVAVIGLDNVEMSSLVEPPLTTVAQPLYEIGRQAVIRVTEMIRYKAEFGTLPPAQTKLLETNLIQRKTTREET